MNTIDFIRETALYISEDRPEIYTPEMAVEEISAAMDHLRQEPEIVFSCVSFTSYMLTRFIDDGVEEFILSRKISSVVLCEEEEFVNAFGYSQVVNLPHIADLDLDSDDDE